MSTDSSYSNRTPFNSLGFPSRSAFTTRRALVAQLPPATGRPPRSRPTTLNPRLTTKNPGCQRNSVGRSIPTLTRWDSVTGANNIADWSMGRAPIRWTAPVLTSPPPSAHRQNPLIMHHPEHGAVHTAPHLNQCQAEPPPAPPASPVLKN